MKKIMINALQYVKSPITNYGRWVTKGKVYKLLPIENTPKNREIVNDHGIVSYISIIEPCGHLKTNSIHKAVNNWIPCDEHGEEVEISYSDGRDEFVSGQYVDSINRKGEITIEAFVPNFEDAQTRITIARLGNVNTASGISLLNTAKLFAASKDLLESLEWLMSKVGDLNGDISIFGMARCYDIIKRARGSFDNMSNQKPFE